MHPLHPTRHAYIIGLHIYIAILPGIPVVVPLVTIKLSLWHCINKISNSSFTPAANFKGGLILMLMFLFLIASQYINKNSISGQYLCILALYPGLPMFFNVSRKKLGRPGYGIYYYG